MKGLMSNIMYQKHTLYKKSNNHVSVNQSIKTGVPVPVPGPKKMSFQQPMLNRIAGLKGGCSSCGH